MAIKSTLKEKIVFLPFISLIIIQLITLYDRIVLHTGELDTDNYVAIALLISNYLIYLSNKELGLLTTSFILLISCFGYEFISFFTDKIYHKYSFFIRIGDDKRVMSLPSMEIRIFLILLLFLIINFQLVSKNIKGIRNRFTNR
ncbi:hypothetical protein BWI96_07680 [Siphonobacter sp. SORGH_AS_0500]|nr:hypothetical protein BWI96_07680 [Siphonobacter sp. SORGH_AS_0500]